MGQRSNNFRQGDVTRAVKAAQQAGLPVARVEVDPKTAKITVIVGAPEDKKPPTTTPGPKPKVKWSAPRKRQTEDTT